MIIIYIYTNDGSGLTTLSFNEDANTYKAVKLMAEIAITAINCTRVEGYSKEQRLFRITKPLEKPKDPEPG